MYGELVPLSASWAMRLAVVYALLRTLAITQHLLSVDLHET